MVRFFWSGLSSWSENYLDLFLAQLSEAEVLLGVSRQVPGFRVKNWLLLCVKFYIQKRRLFCNPDISLIGFLAEIRNYVHRKTGLHDGETAAKISPVEANLWGPRLGPPSQGSGPPSIQIPQQHYPDQGYPCFRRNGMQWLGSFSLSPLLLVTFLFLIVTLMYA